MRAIADAWEKCTRDERERGARFYPNAQAVCRALASEFGVDLVRVAGIMAALSPSTAWRENQKACRDLLAGRDDRCRNYRRDVIKALFILGGAPPENVVTGPKTSAFFRLMRDGGNPHDVCIDGHMANIAHGRKVPLSTVVLRAGEYQRIADGVREVAERERREPHVIQASLWIAWRSSEGFRQGRLL